MLEWLTAAVGTELAKKVWETGLELGTGAAEDYVKDFFKNFTVFINLITSLA